ncbi:MAG TPA: response regulator [Sphingomonas sp.]|jgi:two-component system response regulator FixJ
MRVYLIDDDALTRRMVIRMLAGEPIECAEFGTAAAFLQVLDALPFGCVLLDIHMPEQDGLDALTEIVARRPFPVIMASGSTDMDDAITAFRRGAVHFLRKPFDRATVMTTLWEAEAIGLKKLADWERRDRASRIHLTPREQQILEATAAGQQSKRVAFDLGLSIRTVEMHRSHVLAKLGAANATQAVAIARSLDLLAPA